MLYISKHHQTGWEGKDPVFEYTLYNADRKIKTTLNSTSKHMNVITAFFNTQIISPSMAQKKRMYEYSTVSKTKFIGYK